MHPINEAQSYNFIYCMSGMNPNKRIIIEVEVYIYDNHVTTCAHVVGCTVCTIFIWV